MNIKPITIASCPRCKSVEDVKNKLLSTNVSNTLVRSEFMIDDQAKYDNSDYTNKEFINGLFCSSCEIGFIPNKVLDEIGISVNTSRTCWIPSMPYGTKDIINDENKV